MAVDSSIVLLPRFTTLVGAGSGTYFKTQPLDVSQFASAQIQVWRGDWVDSDPPAAIPPFMQVSLQESLDGVTWMLGASAPLWYEIALGDPKLFSYGFRLRWFRLVVETNWAVTCWAEGILR